MSVAVFTPSCRPGLDVTVASLERQGRELLWIVGDTLNREAVLRAQLPPGIELHYFDSSKLTGRWGSLEAAYNHALEIARERGCEMLVSLQDYIWAPADGIARFEQLAAEHPWALLTGVCSISEDPPASEVADSEGPYTIFAEPYSAKPGRIGWEDCRLDRVSEQGFQMQVEATRYELNWAAIPHEALHDEHLRFDERYDQGWAYGNQAYAQQALKLGYEIWLDGENHAIGLPHKSYFPDQQAVLEQHNNRTMHELNSRIYR